MAIPNVTLLRDLVMIKAVELTLSKSEGGIIVPGELDKLAPKRATVVATGPGTYSKKGDFVACPVQAGDEILYVQANITPIKLEGIDYYLFPATEVLAKLNSAAPVKTSSSSLTSIRLDVIKVKLIDMLKATGLVQLDDMSAPVDLFEPIEAPYGVDLIPLTARSFMISEESLKDPFLPPAGTVAFSMWEVVDRIPGAPSDTFVARLAFSERADLKKA